jgi:hypothetical protein
MHNMKDGPSSSHFRPVPFKGNVTISGLRDFGVSGEMAQAAEHAPNGQCVNWGIPFEIGDVVAIRDRPVTIEFAPLVARWLIFMHTSDVRQIEPSPVGFF